MPQQYLIRGRATTVLKNDDGWNKVIDHGTIVCKWNDKQIILNSNGWLTSTTKNRINQAANQFGLGISVIQRDFEWYVIKDNRQYKFTDNMVIDR